MLVTILGRQIVLFWLAGPDYVQMAFKLLRNNRLYLGQNIISSENKPNMPE